MRNLLALLPLLLAPSLAFADAPAASDTLSEDEGLTMCAEALPKQLECKKEFCTAMVKIRFKDKKADTKSLENICLKEIETDGTGDLAARKARCSAWAKERPKMSMTRTEAKEMDACWTKPSCKDKVDCWSPKMSKVMEASAPKKK
jgi:hypothetical protein